jgi:uncharacterized protein YjbI with pentapeptide repeats
MFVLWLNRKGEKQQENRRYQEEIDDFRGWHSDEAAHRIAGSIKRLNRKGIANIELNHCYLGKVNLSRVNLRGARLFQANLRGANLSGADLRSGDLYCANLSSADLSHVNLRTTDLRRVNLSGANLSRADLTGAKEWANEQLAQAESLVGATMPDGRVMAEEAWEEFKKQYQH